MYRLSDTVVGLVSCPSVSIIYFEQNDVQECGHAIKVKIFCRVIIYRHIIKSEQFNENI